MLTRGYTRLDLGFLYEQYLTNSAYLQNTSLTSNYMDAMDDGKESAGGGQVSIDFKCTHQLQVLLQPYKQHGLPWILCIQVFNTTTNN